MTVQGRSKETTRAIAKSRARLGVESTNDWLPAYTPRFIDFPFTNPDATFDDHMSVVRNTNPEVAVAPDVERGRALEDVVAKADKLLAHADTVVVVPKSVHPSRVPDRFRVGVPLANFGSGAPFGVWDYTECDEVHLLGGPPGRQLTVADHIPSEVASVDTATLGQRCRFGMWDRGAVHAPDAWGYEKRLQKSLSNYATMWSEAP